MGATDEFFLACPNIFLYTKEEANGIKSNGIFEKIIFFQDSESNQERFKTCNAEGLTSKVEHSCSPSIGKPFYQVTADDFEAKTFVFSTSFLMKQNLDGRTNGSCAGQSGFFPLKMTIMKCAADDKPCQSKICDTMSCYEERCGVWSSWVQTDDFVWNGTQCLQRHTRSCQSSLFTCNGATEEYRIAPSRDNCTFEKTECPSSSISPSPSIVSSTVSNDVVASSNILSSMNCPSCSCQSFSNVIQTSVVSNVTGCRNVTVTKTQNQNVTETIQQSIPVNVTVSVTETVNVTQISVSIEPVNVTVNVTQTSVSVKPVNVTVSVTETVNVTRTTVSVKPVNVTVSITETVNVIQTVAISPVVVTSCTNTFTESCDKNKLCTASTSVVQVTPGSTPYKDISYDDKFYITVISAIVGAILVGIFVTHACIAYRKGNKIKKTKVIQVQEYNSQKVTVKEHSTKVTQNRGYTAIGTSSPVN